ncbi:MAG: H4MPT-linked C1 transfer pathway protein [Methylotenera sp.]|nr:H4MPT-linked C1 transfer pathway protein [Methylotenera sp.]MSP99360.1 H4MPT-linked C1 transfer pathway protein [Methylotenera sp.]
MAKVAKNSIGWDIGGAHLKAVQIDARGSVLAVSQVYCPLWRGLPELDRAIDEVLSILRLESYATSHFVTMTGELADIFPNRHAGVVQIAHFVAQKFSGNIMFYAGYDGFVPAGEVGAHAVSIASMNWLASVQYLAHNKSQALFLDIGSTTTDIALILEGKPCVLGFTDAMRLQTDELVYSGVVRTPLMAIAQKIAFAGHIVNVTAEHFATTADVYTLTGDLACTKNSAETSDGADKSVEACARRIARMIGWDAQDAPLPAWRNLAHAFKNAQLTQIKQAMLRKIALLEDHSDLCVVGAGAGDFLVATLAQELGLKYASIAQFIVVAQAAKNTDEAITMAALCFPAYAVACLGVVA